MTTLTDVRAAYEAADDAANGDSNDREIELLRDALDTAVAYIKEHGGDLAGPEEPEDPADAPWTVMGIFDSQGEEIVTCVLRSHIGPSQWSSEYGSWSAHVRAEDATEAAEVALADRAGD